MVSSRKAELLSLVGSLFPIEHLPPRSGCAQLPHRVPLLRPLRCSDTCKTPVGWVDGKRCSVWRLQRQRRVFE
jgi:hypothetical protein